MEFIKFVEDKLLSVDSRELTENHPLGHELDEFANHDPHGFKEFVGSLGTWAKEHPGKILKVLHAIRPVLTIKNVSVVTAYDGVKDVLGRDGDFAVTYDPKMKMITQGAGFFLGFDDDNEKGFLDRSNMQLLFRRDDVSSLVLPIINSLAQKELANLANGFDLVGDYLNIIPAKFAIEYFGFQNIEPLWLHDATAALFEYLFIDVTDNPVITERAEKFAAQLREKLDAELDSSGAPQDSIVSRGLALNKEGVQGFDAINLRNNIIGLLIGLVPTTAKSAAMAYDYGTQNKEKVEHFVTYFKEHNFTDFTAYVRELTRLNPINPGLFRKATRDTTVCSKGKHYKIAKDNIVFVGTYTAMQDLHVLDDPSVLMPGRPDSSYLTYGFGLHACFGRYINDIHVAALLYNCFKAGHFTRTEGHEGNLEFKGAFPVHLVMQS